MAAAWLSYFLRWSCRSTILLVATMKTLLLITLNTTYRRKKIYRLYRYSLQPPTKKQTCERLWNVRWTLWKCQLQQLHFKYFWRCYWYYVAKMPVHTPSLVAYGNIHYHYGISRLIVIVLTFTQSCPRTTITINLKICHHHHHYWPRMKYSPHVNLKL